MLASPPPVSSLANAPRPARTVADLLAALPEGSAISPISCPPDTPLGRPVDDSRAVEAGSCFIAVAGATHDGHDFAASAAAAGAGLLILEAGRGPERAELGVPVLELRDTAAALPILAAAWHGWPGEQLRLAGITGTNGKTTCAHLLAAVLRRAGRPYLRLGTTGNWLVDRELESSFTTPFPVELQGLLATARDRGARDGVMEVSSHALAQGRARPLRYRAVALTSFSQDHLDFHPSMAAYLEAKCRLAREHCAREGVAVAPREQGEAAAAFLRAAAEAGVARCWSTARDPQATQADIRVLERRQPSRGPGLAARVATPVGELELRSPLVGAFNLDNLLVTIGLGIGLELELPVIAEALAEAPGAPGRLEAVRVPGVAGPAVYVDYAHTPDAVARALEALRPSTVGSLIVVLGCGGDRDRKKRPIMGRMASLGADRFVASSDNPRSEDPERIVDDMLAGVVPEARGGASVLRVVDRGRAIAEAIAAARDEDVVLIAGKGHEDYQILADETIHFDDREQAAAALARRR